MSEFELNLNKAQLALAKRTMKESVALFTERKATKKVERANNVLKALNKKQIVMPAADLRMLRASSVRSANQALRALKDVHPITAKHIDEVNAFRDLAASL